MAGLFKQPKCHIFHSGFLHTLIDPLHAFSTVTYRIVLTGENQDRQTGIPAIIFEAARCSFHRTEKLIEQSGRNILSYQRVGKVLIQLCFIGAEPVRIGAVGLEFLIVSAEGQLTHQIGGLVITGFFDLPLHNAHHDGQQPPRLMPGACNDRAGDAIGILSQILTQQK